MKNDKKTNKRATPVGTTRVARQKSVDIISEVFGLYLYQKIYLEMMSKTDMIDTRVQRRKWR